MVIDPQFPHCPIRNVLARLCGSDTLQLLYLLDRNKALTRQALYKQTSAMSLRQFSKALAILQEDRLVVLKDDSYHLSSLAHSFLPFVYTPFPD
ncbi:MarR family transcriptional regulator [Prevotella sp.]|uniref:MarR family transcriptional regulator n=1 Tax=Prevotella sp. TaxID=59823 RepID=UPI002F94E1BA